MVRGSLITAHCTVCMVRSEGRGAVCHCVLVYLKKKLSLTEGREARLQQVKCDTLMKWSQ